MKTSFKRWLPSPRFFITACGAWTLFAVVALILIAINYGNNLVFATAFLVLAVLLQAGWDNWRALSGVEAVLLPPAAVFAGDAVKVEADLLFVSLRAREGLALVGEGTNSDNNSDLYGEDSERRHRSAYLALDWRANGRGWKTLDRISLATRAPLGLWRSRRPLAAVRVLVYPQPVGESLPPKSASYLAHGAPQAESFAGVREYAPGDSLTRINWRIYGRRDELATNVFDGGAGQHARHLAWNDTNGETEIRLSQLARWVLEADREGEEYCLDIPGLTLGPDRGPAHRGACLSTLALFGTSDTSDTPSPPDVPEMPAGDRS